MSTCSFSGWLCCRVEGFFFALLIPLLGGWALFWSLVHWIRRGAWPKGVWHRSWCRWKVFLAQGLRPLRENWWIPLQFEGASTIWRYLALIECLAFCCAPCEKSASLKEDRILVIRLGHIGDFLHAIPLLKSLRQQRPNAHIAVMVGPWVRELAGRFPYYNEVIIYQPRLRQYHRERESSWGGWWAEWRFLRSLNAKPFDVVLSLEPHPLVDIALMLSVQHGRWLEYEQSRFPYAVDGTTRHTMSFDSRRYESDALMDFLLPQGLVRGAVELEFPVSDEESSCAEVLLRGQGLESGGYVVLAPGAGWPGKIWPADRYAQLADWMLERHNLRSVVLGSPSESPLGRQIETAVRHRVVNLIGKTSLGVVGALVRKARLYVGNDNGLLHIAAAVGCSTVAVFGPTFFEKWAPRGPHHCVVSNRDEACPLILCYPWHPSSGCEQNQACIRAIKLAQVQASIDHILERAA